MTKDDKTDQTDLEKKLEDVKMEKAVEKNDVN